jgi:type IV secretory pathway protease TraF
MSGSQAIDITWLSPWVGARYVVVSSTLVYRKHPSTSERPKAQRGYLTGFGVLMEWYHRLWSIENKPVPVRDQK